MSQLKSIAIKAARSAALIAVLSYVGLGVLLWFAQGAMVFPAPAEMRRDPGERGWNFEEVRIPVMGYETLGWYVPLEHHRGVALYSHGNAENLSGCLKSIEILRSFGFSVLAYDYGGYGHSTGTPSEKRCNADIRAMWDYLIAERGIPADDILLYGRSVGGGPTCDLAKDVTPGAVILESTFLSTTDVAWTIPIYRPWVWLLRHTFKNKDKVAQFTAPLLIVHSSEDEIIPFEHGKELFWRAREPKTLLEITGGHNNGYDASEETYRAGWEAFLMPIFGEYGREANSVGTE